MAARGKTGSPGRASRGEVSYRGLQPASTTLKIYGVFRKLRSEGRRTGGGGGGWRLGESARREDTVENWGQDENWRAKHDESENSWAKQFPRRVDGIEGIKKIRLADFRSVFSLGVCI